MQTTQTKVLIVGAGPTGMTAAMELSRLGVAVRIIDKAACPATTSRAIGVQARTLELLQQRGLVQPMLDHGNKGVAGSIYGAGKRIFRLDYENNGSRYPFMLFVSQADTEAILRTRLEAGGVTIERPVKFMALAQSELGDAMQAILKRQDGSLEAVVCDYLIDCEGAHSIARTTMNIAFAGKTRAENYLLADIHFTGGLSDSDFHIFSSEHGFMGMFPLGKGRFRLIASNPLSQAGKSNEPSMDEVQKIYDQRSPIAGRFHDMTWSSWFRINSRMVDTLRIGRIFLGGDSAHIHSPAGAQGMNTGIQDMINLSWKLALVIQNKATPHLLDTYQEDRLPVIKNVLTKTEGLTDAIGSEERLFRLAFAYVAPIVVGLEAVQHKSTEQMSQLSLNYRGSPISTTRHAVGGIHAGDRIPDVTVARVGGAGEAHAGSSMTNLFSLLTPDRFTLLFTNLHSPEAVHSEVQARLGLWQDLLQTHSIAASDTATASFHDTFGRDEGMILVRPDGYAGFTGSAKAVPALAEYLARWFTPPTPENPET